tara:strand:+ start:496 stop:768 length:273 start_codon:yes stop_codon:yes gene_type:complete
LVPEVILQAAPVICGIDRLDSRLVFMDGVFVALLTHLAGEHYGDDQGRWFLEASFGSYVTRNNLPEPFADLDEAVEWLTAAAQSHPIDVN